LTRNLPFAVVAALACATAPAFASAPAMRVAVLEFGNASSEAGLEALGKGLQSMVTTDLARVASLTLVERARLQEIVAEQKLGASGMVDKSTAAKIGKLAGATHLLGGTFTVVAKAMRIDARLFTVQAGEVLLAEEVSGERDAFFEIEKALVHKLVGALGVKLDPKERAGIAKIHTADFGAFKLFSQAVAEFDHKRYDEALQALRAATRIDTDFQLARLTLAEYEEVVAKIRSKAAAIDVETRNVARAKADQDFDNDQRVAERLVAIAREPGPEAAVRRLAALSWLIGFYDHHGRNHGRVSRYQDHFDGLWVRRHDSGLVRLYLQEAQKLFPQVPLFDGGRHPPDKPEDVDKRIEGMVRSLRMGHAYQPAQRDAALARNLTAVRDIAAQMAADPREVIKLYELALASSAKVPIEAYDKIKLYEGLAEAQLDVGDVDAASAGLARASAIETDAGDLRSLAKRIEELGKLSALLAATDKKDELRELIAAGERNLPTLAKLFAAAGPPSPRMLQLLCRRRELTRWWAYRDPVWWLGGEPAHLISGEYVLFSGPRVDGKLARALRYYRAARHGSKEVLVATGAAHRGDLQAWFELRFTRAADFWPPHAPQAALDSGELTLDPGRPEVIFVFGLRDVDTPNNYDPDQKKQVWAAPVQAWGVRINAAGTALVRLGEDAPATVSPTLSRAVTVAESPKAATGDKVPVRIAVKGREVKVSVGGQAMAFALPDARAGFTGVILRGEGYVEVADWRVQ